MFSPNSYLFNPVPIRRFLHSVPGIYITFFDETVNSVNYLEMLEGEFIPFLRNNNILDETYFMQDGAKPHTSNVLMDYLNENFEERVISGRYRERFGYGLSWSAYSPDLNPCDFFLWGYLKSRVYMNRPKTIDELKSEILKAASNIPHDMLIRVVQNFKKRLNAVQVVQGKHIEQTAVMKELRKDHGRH